MGAPKGIGRRFLKGLEDAFMPEVPGEGEEGAPDGASDHDASDGTDAAALPAMPPVAAGDDELGILSASFPEIYVGLSVPTDANADVLLNTFAGMAALDESARRTAMQAMMSGMRADTARVVEVVRARVQAIETTVSFGERTIGDRRAKRDTKLGAKREETARRIAELRDEIARLEGALKEESGAASYAETQDVGRLTGFKARAATEEQGLKAFLAFLATISPKGK